MGLLRNTGGKAIGICLNLGFSHENRWHADIKPDNILEIQGKFKLADPGFAKFLKKAKEDPNSNPTADIAGGTHTFGKELPFI